MLSDTVRWVLGIVIAAILGSYGYTTYTGNSAIAYVDKVEERWTERMDRFERKLDRVIERNR
jgi:hypothetical protein